MSARPFVSAPTDLDQRQHVLYDLRESEREDVSDVHPEITRTLFKTIRRSSGHDADNILLQIETAEGVVVLSGEDLRRHEEYWENIGSRTIS